MRYLLLPMLALALAGCGITPPKSPDAGLPERGDAVQWNRGPVSYGGRDGLAYAQNPNAGPPVIQADPSVLGDGWERIPQRDGTRVVYENEDMQCRVVIRMVTRLNDDNAQRLIAPVYDDISEDDPVTSVSVSRNGAWAEFSCMDLEDFAACHVVARTYDAIVEKGLIVMGVCPLAFLPTVQDDVRRLADKTSIVYSTP